MNLEKVSGREEIFEFGNFGAGLVHEFLRILDVGVLQRGLSLAEIVLQTLLRGSQIAANERALRELLLLQCVDLGVYFVGASGKFVELFVLDAASSATEEAVARADSSAALASCGAAGRFDASGEPGGVCTSEGAGTCDFAGAIAGGLEVATARFAAGLVAG